ncbi:Holin family protein [compost metagenome]
MKEELYDILLGVYEYVGKVVDYVKPTLAFLFSVISYILFPDDAYIAPTIGLVGLLILDVATKYYAIAKQNGGFRKAVRTRKISSDSMWRGTKKKLVSILVVMICCGLLIRFTEFFPIIAVLMTTVCYSFMGWRELQSVAENMIDAGHDDLRWFLNLIKKKKKDFLDDQGVGDIESNDENESNTI